MVCLAVWQFSHERLTVPTIEGVLTSFSSITVICVVFFSSVFQLSSAFSFLLFLWVTIFCCYWHILCCSLTFRCICAINMQQEELSKGALKGEFEGQRLAHILWSQTFWFFFPPPQYLWEIWGWSLLVKGCYRKVLAKSPLLNAVVTPLALTILN